MHFAISGILTFKYSVIMKTIIFDLDGVIVHTDQYHYKAWKIIADELDIEFDQTINNRLRGVSRMESLDIILENYNTDLSQDEKNYLAENKNNHYREMLNEMSPSDLSKEVKETLDTLKNRGYRMAIGSSSKNAPLILSKIGLGDYFDVVSDGNNITKSKPDPEVFVKAAEFLNSPPYECVVIEDAVAGIEAAKNAGMKAIAIGDARKSDKADIKIEDIPELLEILK